MPESELDDKVNCRLGERIPAEDPPRHFPWVDSDVFSVPLTWFVACLQILIFLQAAGARAEAAGLKSQLHDLRTRLENEIARLREDAEVSRTQFEAASSKVGEGREYLLHVSLV